MEKKPKPAIQFEEDKNYAFLDTTNGTIQLFSGDKTDKKLPYGKAKKSKCYKKESGSPSLHKHMELYKNLHTKFKKQHTISSPTILTSLPFNRSSPIYFIVP